MSFYDIYSAYKGINLKNNASDVSLSSIISILGADVIDIPSFAALLSLSAENCLEEMAQKAHQLTLQYFGRTIQLYTPMYLSDFCENECAYCGFNFKNDWSRRKLSLDEVEKEAAFIASSGLKHILILTGDSRRESPVSYIKDCVVILKKYFSSISIEIYALTEDEYTQMVACGVDGLTIYQETYDEVVYDQVHRRGPKKDYLFRLDAAQRAANSGMRSVNIGALLGLNDWRREVFFLGLHARYLQDKFPDVDVSVSVPRLRPHAGDFKDICVVSDKNLVQIITSLRIFLPRVGISLSTREDAQLRDHLLFLGITRMSAASSTQVGGHTIACSKESNVAQFEISDKRNVAEIKGMLSQKGYQPVFKDWMLL